MAFEDLHRPLTAAGFKGVIRWMIVVSGAVLLLQQFIGPPLSALFGLVPARVLRQFWIWQPFTYPLLHGGLFHWLFNMFIFWMFGRELEVRWGSRGFILYCVIASLGAAAAVLAIAPGSVVPVIGSSGIVFGLLLAFAYSFPHSTMYLYFLIPMKTWQVASLFALVEAVTIVNTHGLASVAHLGGMASGFLYLYLRPRVRSVLKRPGGWFPFRRGSQRNVQLHVVTDELISEVDRILEKILKDGAQSLTSHEKQVMEKYSRLKH